MISLKARILAILLQVPRTDADKVWDADDDYREARLDVLATAIDRASKGSFLMAGALITQARSESALDSGWASCNCQGAECDHGKAHGYFQQHNAPSWPSDRWASFCWTMWQPAMDFAAKLTANRINTAALECSFAHLGGASVPCDAKWAVARAEKAREIAGKLKPRKPRKSRRR